MFSSSNELLINMKGEDIPTWKHKLPFYEQDKSTIQFWQNEMDKVKNGLNIGGFFVHPWLYYHLNIFKTQIATKKGDVFKNPPLDDNFMYVIETYQEADEKGLGMGLFGTRGFAKSVILASNSLWTITKNTSGGIFDIVGGSTKDLEDIYNLIIPSNSNTHKAFQIPQLNSSKVTGVNFGLRNKSGDVYNRGRIRITNTSKGKDKKSEDIAGGTPIGAIYDEIGKSDPREALKAHMPAFRSQYGARFVHILAGTGGNKELSAGAKEVLENPKEYNLLPINFERLERNVPDKEITWKKDHGRSFCTFLPAQMSYRLDSPKKSDTLANFLHKKNKSLENIKIQVTDWKIANNKIKKLIDNASRGSKDKVHIYYPTCIDHCFLENNNNPFPVERCIANKTRIENEQKYRRGFLERSTNRDDIEFVMNIDAIVAGREYKNEPINSPFLFYENIPETIPPANKFVSSLDDYNLPQAKQSDSLGSFYIIKRKAVDTDSPIEKIVASLATRPKKHEDFYKQMSNGIIKFNAICCMESINIGFVDFFDKRGEEPERFLAKAFSPSDELLTHSKSSNKLRSRFGVYPNTANNRYMLNLVIKYANEDVEVGVDDKGFKIFKKGVDFIPDPMLLQEMIDYNPKSGNYDRIMSFGQGLAYCKRLDRLNIIPDSEERKDKSVTIPKRKKTIKFNNFSSGRRKFRRF